MNRVLPSLIFIYSLMAVRAASAMTIGCDPAIENCWGSFNRGSRTTNVSYPSTSSGFHLNPSAVPTSKTFGGELIYFNQQYDASIVQGTGRVGAAISLQNGEESFFGAPSYEVPPEYLARKNAGLEYQSQKLSLASAFSLYDNHHGDLSHLQASLGLQLQYNRPLQTVSPGVGVSGIVGPISLGVAYARDQELVNCSKYGLGPDQIAQSEAVTYSLGVYLHSVSIDYSILQVRPERVPYSGVTARDVSILTTSVAIRKWMLTASLRRELSDRPAYDFKDKVLYPQYAKQEEFGGVQFAPIPSLLFGVFYNYYLMHELSLGLTIFL